MKRIAHAASMGLTLLAVGCGNERDERAPTGRAQGRVIDGQVDDTDKAAIGLAINVLNVYFTGHCSGTLIAPNLVLTARHCVSLTSGGGPQNSVICGQTNFNNPPSGAIFRVTTETVRPLQDGPEFYKGTGTVVVPPNSTDICGNDVALITLEGAGVPESVTKPIIPRIDSKPEDGETYAAVGYGLTDPNNQNSSGTRMRADGKLVFCLGGLCGGIGGEQVKVSEWEGEKGTCPGDSGGPALDAQGRVMGVLSRGPQPCGPSVYGDVSAWKDLIIDTAKKAAEAGGYAPPFWVTTGSSTPPPPEPDAGAGGAGGASGNPGKACSVQDPCSGGYKCYAAGGQDTGTCVAPCDPAAPACSSGSTCDEKLGACIPQATSSGKGSDSGDSGGCATQGPAKPVPWLWGLALGALVALRRRRAPR